MRRRFLHRRMGGFSLVELMVVVGIVAILAAFAAPNMRDMVRKQRVRTTSFDVFSSLTLARSEAIKRNVSVTMTPTGGSWAAGWKVAADLAASGDANGVELRRQGSVSSVTMSGPASVTYNGTGRLAAAVAPFQMTADVSGAQEGGATTTSRCVSVDLSGRPVSKIGAC